MEKQLQFVISETSVRSKIITEEFFLEITGNLDFQKGDDVKKYYLRCEVYRSGDG